MVFCMHWCSECGRSSLDLLTNYKGRMICKDCKHRLEQEEERQERERRERERRRPQ